MYCLLIWRLSVLMNRIIICGYAEDLLFKFGNLILSDFINEYSALLIYENHENECKKICSSLGIKQFQRLEIMYSESLKETLFSICEKLPNLSLYDDVYCYSVKDSIRRNAVIAAAVGSKCVHFWSLAVGGIVDDIVSSDAKSYSYLIKLINKYVPYSLVTSEISTIDIKNVLLLQKVSGLSQYRYFLSCIAWSLQTFDLGSPWELATSKYENNRHELELAVLSKLSWKKIVEIGACEGIFTQKLCKKFPNAKVLAIEPDNYFYAKLKELKYDNIRTIHADCSIVKDMEADVLFISNVLYYLSKIPDEIFKTKARYICVCHDIAFHKQVLDIEFINRGFVLIEDINMAPCLEPMEGIMCIKYGFNIKVWKPSIHC